MRVPRLLRPQARIAVIGAALMTSAPALAVTPINSNLVFNSGAESDTGAGTFSDVVVPSGWTTSIGMTAVKYAIGGSGDLNLQDSQAIGGGNNYFAGGPNAAASVASQTITFADLSADIDAGLTPFRLSADLGGYDSQPDSAVLNVHFQNGSGGFIVGGAFELPAATAADRANTTQLLHRSLVGTIPVGARSALIRLDATRQSGSYNDGYADNLSFAITATPGDANLDGRVQFADLVILAQNYNLGGRTWTTGDFDATGTTAFSDLVLLAQNYGSGGSVVEGVDPTFAAHWALAQSLVPEPSLALSVMVGAVITSRRSLNRQLA
jgi:hypothetical protein